MSGAIGSCDRRSAEASTNCAHPFDIGRFLKAANVADMVSRALDCVDPRLIEHGLRVACTFDAMMDVDGSFDDLQRKKLHMTALLHDVGAYRTEEIDRMVAFETGDVWEHALYGYLFFKELSPLAEYADVILYHHMPYALFSTQDECVRFLSQALQVADRVDVLLIDHPNASLDELVFLLETAPHGQFSEEAVALFAQADRRFGLLEQWRTGAASSQAARVFVDSDDSETAAAYLDMLVHVIDFRSRHTVTHTVTTAWVAYELAVRMLPEGDAACRVYVGALLHDLGKIGVPVSVLEKPGRLDDREMALMRTHVAMTERVIAGCVDDDVARVAIRHHEKLDGSGYPRGLHAERLTLSERIVAVADIVSALVGTRSYKEAYPKDRVLSILAEQSEGGLIDSEVVQVVTRDYDDIMRSVGCVCAPVRAVHQRVQDEYLWLLEQLEQERAKKRARRKVQCV